MKESIVQTLALVLVLAGTAMAKADKRKTAAWDWMDANQQPAIETSRFIWEHPEIGEQEFESSARLAGYLEDNGFSLQKGVADLPTAWVATWANGAGPVIGYLCEYDALPGLSQEAGNPNHVPVVEGAPGHGCGHSLLGVGAAFAAVGLKQAMTDNKISGTVKVFGCPAEETLVGKVYMVRDGVFNGIDIALGWHPGSENSVVYSSSLAMSSIKFRFFGRTAHGAGNPQHGRSALDAVELTDVGVNFMREHVIEKARIHYVITNGGGAPNVVPDKAEVWYFVRAPETEQMRPIYDWVREIAKGAAIMTQTRLEEELLVACWDFLPNEPLAKLLYENFTEVGPPPFDQADWAFARALAQNFEEPDTAKLLHEEIEKLEIVPMDKIAHTSGSVDDGDVSWCVPYGRITGACSVHGASGHSWQTVTCAGSDLGFKGMATAAKVLAGAGLELMRDRKLIDAAWADFRTKTATRKYECGVPDGLPPPSRRYVSAE